MILEKAFAKLHGSYERIVGGLSYETFRDVLGAPAYLCDSNDEDAFKRILDADKKEYILCAGAEGDADQ